jgi:hypothetical protein
MRSGHFVFRSHTREKNFKNFLEMTPLRVETCGASEFDIFTAKKRFPDSDKARVLKRKVAKIAFFEKIFTWVPLYYVVASVTF